MVVEGRRISASPRPWPCNGRILSLLANKMKPRPDAYVSTFSKLLRREISSKRCFSISNAHEKFRNLRLVDEYDTHDPKGHCPVALPFLMKRRKVIVIVAARDIVFALAHSGVCAAFDRVSVNATDNFSSSKCRSTKIEYIQSGKPDPDFALFESKSLKWPGFVEFDDVNGKVLTYSAQDSIYKVFDLKNYTMLYSISDKHVHEIKISPGIMLLIFNRASGHIPLKILSVEDGTVLKTFKHVLH